MSPVCRISSRFIFNLRTLIHSIRVLAQSSTLRFHYVHLQFHSESSHGDSDPSPSINDETVLETLSSYANDWKKAKDFFDWTENNGFQHTTTTYNQVIDILSKFSQFDLSWKMIHQMSNNTISPPDHVTFRIMFKRYSCARLADSAIEAFDRSGGYKLKDRTSFSNLIDALCEYKHVTEAEELCERSEWGPSTKMKNMILRGWSKIGWWRKCREVWEGMEEKDLHSYSIYMDILYKSGKPWKGVRLYYEMKKKKMKLDVIAYNTAIHSVGAAKGVDAAMALYREMLEGQCEPNVATYNMLIKMLGENYRTPEAYKMVKRIGERGMRANAITYHCLMGCMKNPGEILEVFEGMLRERVRPRLDTYVMLLRKFGKRRYLRPVFYVWEKMEENGCSPDGQAYDAFINALLAKGMVDLAKKYDEEKVAKGLASKPRVELRPEPRVQDVKN